MGTIPQELQKLKDSLDGKLDSMTSSTNTIQNNITNLMNATNTAKNGIDSNYDSANKATVLGSFNSLNGALSKVVASFGDLNSILSGVKEVIGKVNELIKINESLEALKAELSSLQSELSGLNSSKENEKNASKISQLNNDIEAKNKQIEEKNEQFEEIKNEALQKLSELKSKDISIDISDSIGTSVTTGTIKVTGGTVVLKEFRYKGYTIPYYLYVPEVEGEVQKLPVHLYLHGAGEMGDGVLKRGLPKQLIDGVIQPSCIMICVQTGKEEYYRDPVYQDALVALTDTVVKENNGDPNRVSASGHSCGANECYRLVKRYPDYFSAIVPYSCGDYISDKEIESFRGTKIWSLHGTKDTHPGLATFNEDYEKTVKKLEDAGVDVNFTPIEGEGHDVQDLIATSKYDDGEGHIINPIEWAIMQTRA